MTEEAEARGPLQLIGAYFTLMTKGDWEAWIDLWADDGVLDFPFSPSGRQRAYAGRPQILAYMKAAVGRMAVDETLSMNLIPAQDPNIAVIELSIRAHAVTTGQPFNQSYVIVIQSRDGKLTHIREYWNPLVSIEAFGEGRTRGEYVSAESDRPV